MNTKTNNEWEKEFENQSMVRVLKQAQDFNSAQYDLLIKLFGDFLSSERQKLRGEIGGIEIPYGKEEGYVSGMEIMKNKILKLL